MKMLLNVMTAAAETASNIIFEPINFITNLKYMGIGMVVIFAVIGVIILTTILVNKAFSK